MKELMTEWRSFLKEDALSGVQTTLNYAYISTECAKVFEKHGISAAVANVFTKNIIKGLQDSAKDITRKGIGVENTANIVSNLTDGLNGIFQLCTKFGVDPGGYFSRFLALTAEGTLAASALTFLSLILLSKSLADFLADTGRELKKSKGPLAIRELRNLENQIKQEGFESVRASEANTALKRMDIFRYFVDAKTFYPNVVEMFPSVFNLLDNGLKKSV
jgi:hypothetical protein